MSKISRNEMLKSLYDRHPNFSDISKNVLQNLIDSKTNIGDYMIEDEEELHQLAFFIENDCNITFSTCL